MLMGSRKDRHQRGKKTGYQKRREKKACTKQKSAGKIKIAPNKGLEVTVKRYYVFGKVATQPKINHWGKVGWE